MDNLSDHVWSGVAGSLLGGSIGLISKAIATGVEVSGQSTGSMVVSLVIGAMAGTLGQVFFRSVIDDTKIPTLLLCGALAGSATYSQDYETSSSKTTATETKEIDLNNCQIQASDNKVIFTCPKP